MSRPNYARPCEPPTRPAFLPLPAGAVSPAGWLRDWCLAARDGYTGHLDEVDPEFTRAWAADHLMTGERLNWPQGAWPYEGGGYWFEGLAGLGFAPHDETLLAQSRRRLVNNAMVSFVDLAPTVLDWAGAKGPDYPLHGRSILPLLEQENPAGRDEVFFSHTFHEITMYYPMRGIRTRRYKYIRNLCPELEYPHASDLWASPTWQSVLKAGERGMVGRRRAQDYLHRPAEELYDITVDPEEVNNLARSAEHREALKQLRARVDAWRRETKDPWLINENYRPPLA